MAFAEQGITGTVQACGPPLITIPNDKPLKVLGRGISPWMRLMQRTMYRKGASKVSPNRLLVRV